MTARPLTRRRLNGLLAVALSFFVVPRLAAQEAPGDRGIGGTGVAPPTDRNDQGIGGTGVVGTIRKFGSIVVNEMRIGYAPDVMVTIDGRAATPGDLRLGQVVRTAALRDDDRFVTRSIAVFSEVIGPVERHQGDRLTVLGQIVDVADLPRPRRWARGTRVAVSGLRRPDGVIVASRIEPTHDPRDRVAGPLQRRPGGGLRIGQLVLRNVDAALVGQRIMATGRRRGGALNAVRAESEAEALQALRSDRLSLEVFLERRGEHLQLGSGLAVASTVATEDLPDNGVVRAVVSGTVQRGQVVVDRIDVVDRRNHGQSGAGPAPGQGARPAGQMPGAMPGRGPSGPGGNPPGGVRGSGSAPGGGGGGPTR